MISRDTSLRSGERQVAPTIEGIRRDHVARYEWCAKILTPNSIVTDVACGCGYGAWIIAQAGHAVCGCDNSREAIWYARQHYRTARTLFLELDAEDEKIHFPLMGAAVCFETIEHLNNPLNLLKAFRRSSPLLVASVPNEASFPFTGQKWHRRHYTAEQFAALLSASDWKPTYWRGQEGWGGPEAEVTDNLTGRTLIAVCV
jgi:2-polyprenyl-3-methyl-5-hydroxy-6-metoxy-1,4-benzoquinol methylase